MSSNLKIDINADLGEGLANEADLIPYLSSCNIACGGHAGDFETMSTVVSLAKHHNVKIGAHPSFPDKASFGRTELSMNTKDLYESLRVQIQDLQDVLQSHDLKMNHIKPHGALYNLAAKDKNTAEVIVDVLCYFSKELKLYAPYKSVISEIAKSKQIDVVFEGFADRNYNEDLSLVSRQNTKALITKKEHVFEHVFQMISNQKVKAINGVEVELFVDTICVHGDTKNAVDILQYLHTNLIANHIEIS
ncbi:5-oxoprolinase subunit PxpA [Winogradskyella jejuensis]|uniref:UPF0271 protein n=1 Tax=Winogradskyella jejuensis TaxID=1089305 RepID=A0A1M5T8S0_9FLAO|nr:5-oxoprolinase subunit PxpA [Winogradskyella jejuensis]SHH47167.1 UPF0271 protein [Winogradskyella jejuensis]